MVGGVTAPLSVAARRALRMTWTRTSEPVRVLADAGDQEALALSALDDADDVHHQDADPEHKMEDPDEATQKRQEVGHDQHHLDKPDGDAQDELGGEQHQAVAGMPLDFLVFLLDHERDDRE